MLFGGGTPFVVDKPSLTNLVEGVISSVEYRINIEVGPPWCRHNTVLRHLLHSLVRARSWPTTRGVEQQQVDSLHVSADIDGDKIGRGQREGEVGEELQRTPESAPTRNIFSVRLFLMQ